MDQFKDKAQLAGEADSASYGSGASDSSDQNYFYNSKRGELLGRSFSSWLKLISFYFLFTAILALLWGLCMGVFFQTLDFYIPKLIDETRNPGLGFRPAGGLGFDNKQGYSSSQSVYSSLVWFKHGAKGNWIQHKADLDIFLKKYEPGQFAGQGSSLTKCSFENNPLQRKQLLGGGTVDESCEFNKEWLSDQAAKHKCISEEDYGYYKTIFLFSFMSSFSRYRYGQPCILLKMNKIYRWEPVPYTYDQILNHTSMPSKLKLDITKIWNEECATRGYTPDGGKPCPWMNMVWLHCDGETYADMENIGPVRTNIIISNNINMTMFR